MIEVKLEKLNPNAKLPSKAHDSDFCYDVWATSEEEIAPNVWKYGLGFRYELIRNAVTRSEWYDISIDLRPRSSIWKTGMSLCNAPGTLDEIYRGEAAAIFYHVFPSMERYHVGDKIGQIKLGITQKMNFEFVDKINTDTERGTGGFGSTGKK